MSTLADLRRAYHERLCSEILGHRPDSIVYNIADGASPVSVTLAKGMAERMGFAPCLEPPSAQTAGSRFAIATCDFIETAFRRLSHLRPGDWVFATTGTAISSFEQYEHLQELRALLDTHRELATALGRDYIVIPDIVVMRRPVTDDEINRNDDLVGDDEVFSRRSPLRHRNGRPATLHASISCKWTMRSDRAQNTRTDALNLIRNRKGGAPHIVAVTLEPQPSRLASIAMGTGDVDCTYHAALDELLAAAQNSPYEDAQELLATLVEGRRLRDISDLPFDLAL